MVEIQNKFRSFNSTQKNHGMQKMSIFHWKMNSLRKVELGEEYPSGPLLNIANPDVSLQYYLLYTPDNLKLKYHKTGTITNYSPHTGVSKNARSKHFQQ